MDKTIEVLKSQTITNIQGMTKGSKKIIFTLSNGRKIKMFHAQECCEEVQLEDVVGDPADLLNSPILVAEVSQSNGNQLNKGDESWTWTFYKLATIKGSVDLRWYGTSNGYYSEDVNIRQLEPDLSHLIGMVCWFGYRRDWSGDRCLGILTSVRTDKNFPYTADSGTSYTVCRPVRINELNFYPEEAN